ncbi:MAG: GNAT family N-acetyltransferase [Clostridia bacterium]|nr:GNAT family N-acetyltransferase [Clostridia bacterium]
MEVRLLKDQERFDAALVSHVAFHMRMEDPEKARETAVKETLQDWGAFDDDGTLMARIINNQYECWLDGKTVRNGGIGAVSTLPEYRNTGSIREIFQALIPHAYADGEVISTLYPFSHAFYRKFGYETVCWKNTYTFAPGVLKNYRFNGKALLWKPGDPSKAWTALYNRFASAYNLAILRNEEAMLEHLKGEYYKDRKFCYLLCDGSRPIAYVIFQDIRHDPAAILEVKDLAWEGRTGFEAILGFLARFSADYGTIRLFLPRDLELLNLIRCPNAYEIEKTSAQNYMIRIINAVKLLETICKPVGSRFVIQVTDDLIPQNNGTWAVTDQAVVPIDEAPDLTVSERALGQLACGAVSLNEAEYRADTVVHANREVLEQVFTRKPILVEDHF